MSATPRTRLAIALAAAALALALPATAQASQTLSVNKAGAGAGTVTSFPAGISCGSTCSAPFNDNAFVTLTASPSPSSQPAQWSGCDTVTAENKCQVTMSGARSVTATFNLVQRQLNVSKAGAGSGTVTSSPGGISCGGTCQATYTHGTEVTLSASLGPNTEAVKWSGCDSTPEGKCKLAMNGAKSVTASFEAEPRLTVAKAGEGASGATVTSSPGGIACGGSCGAFYGKGTLVTLTGTPGLHTKAVTWTGCDEVLAGQCKVTMSAAKGVTATFNLEEGFSLVTLSIAKTGTGSGTVTGSPGGINCGAACSTQLISGTQVTLTASPEPGSVFSHWSGGGCSGAGPCTTTVKAAKTVKVVFSLSGKRALSVTKAGNGQGTVKGKAAGIACGTDCSSQVPAGKKVTLSAKPAAGSTFAGWSGACSGTAKTCKVTMSEARSVTATFTAPPALRAASCVVPKLRGKTLRKARSALSAAHCVLGKVRRPKAKKGHKLGPLVVKSSSPAAGSALPAGAKVDLKLAKAHKRRHR